MAKKAGKRYSAKNIYGIVGGIRRHLQESLLHAATCSLDSFGVFVLSTVSFNLLKPAEIAGKAFLHRFLC